MTATLDRISEGRLLINAVSGGELVKNKGDGLFMSHDERYEVTREFLDIYLDIYKAVLRGETVISPENTSRSRMAGCYFLRIRNRIRHSQQVSNKPTGEATD